MKAVYVVVCAVLFAALQAPCVQANEIQEYRSEADLYYQQENFKKAYKAYYKLAKTGDHYSQHLVSTMYANGEGKKVNLTKAYAWSVLAAEGGQEQMVNYSEELLQRTNDKSKSLESASRLKKKYGKQALEAKAKQRGRDELYIAGSDCTGSRLPCKKR
jgi:TPR repeat protein